MGTWGRWGGRRYGRGRRRLRQAARRQIAIAELSDRGVIILILHRVRMLTLMMMLRAMDDVRKGMDVMTTTVVTMVVETSGEVMRRRRKMLSGWRAWQVKRYQ